MSLWVAAARCALTLGALSRTRDDRHGDRPAHWITGWIGEHAELDASLVDLRGWPLPMFDQSRAPVIAVTPLANRWAVRMAEADGFVITAAEYHHGYTAVLETSLDWAFREWSRKPVTFVGHGGARAVEPLHEVAVELEMAPLRHVVHRSREVPRHDEHSAPVDPSMFAATR